MTKSEIITQNHTVQQLKEKFGCKKEFAPSPNFDFRIVTRMEDDDDLEYVMNNVPPSTYQSLVSIDGTFITSKYLYFSLQGQILLTDTCDHDDCTVVSLDLFISAIRGAF